MAVFHKKSKETTAFAETKYSTILFDENIIILEVCINKINEIE